jgi:hypothetical protein
MIVSAAMPARQSTAATPISKVLHQSPRCRLLNLGRPCSAFGPPLPSALLHRICLAASACEVLRSVLGHRSRVPFPPRAAPRPSPARLAPPGPRGAPTLTRIVHLAPSPHRAPRGRQRSWWSSRVEDQVPPEGTPGRCALWAHLHWRCAPAQCQWVSRAEGLVLFRAASGVGRRRASGGMTQTDRRSKPSGA